MSWQITGRARVDPENPKAFGVCDRCGFLYQQQTLQWQYQWDATRLQNLRILVCHDCLDVPQEQLRRVVIQADPIPIANPRVGEFGSMIFSSAPQTFNTIAPSQLVVQSPIPDTLSQTTIGDRSPIVTQLSSLPILTEVTVTPYPFDSGYIGPGDTNTPALNSLTGQSTTTSS